MDYFSSQTDGRSFARMLADLPEEGLAEIFAGLSREQQALMLRHWPLWARDGQRAPEGAWRVWLILAGRGYGKTRSGAEWVRGFATRNGDARIALVGATIAEARAVMVEGEAGLLAIARGDERPEWEPSLHRLRWPGGATATIYSAAEPDSLRGPAHDAAWADEIAKWDKGEAAWDNLMLGLRRGDYPRAVATTTPRPCALLRRLIAEAEAGATVTVTRGRTRDNRAHLPAPFLSGIEASYRGTRLGRQELDGELIEDVEGSLWPRELIEACRVAAGTRAGTPITAAPVPSPVPLARIVVGVDPPAGVGADACGIVVAGLGEDKRGYVLEDASVSGARPEGWARAVAGAAARWNADRVIAETNQGGAMVESVLRAVERNLPLKPAHASKSKTKRAEPVAALYEHGRVSHVGTFRELEDEMAGMTIAGEYLGPGRSPDRADALVWALTELMLREEARPAVRVL